MYTQRLLNEQSLTTGDAMDASIAPDLGEYNRLHLLIRVSQAATGSAPALVFKHALCNEASAWVDFDTPVSVDLTGTDAVWVHVDAITRFLGWSTTGTFDTPAIVTVDILAKG